MSCKVILHLDMLQCLAITLFGLGNIKAPGQTIGGQPCPTTEHICWLCETRLRM